MDLTALQERISDELASIHSMEDLRRVKVSLLGRKGLFPDYYDRLKTMELDRRRTAGREINSLKGETEARLGELEAAYAAAEQERKAQEALIDVTLPGKKPLLGRRHPITLVFDEIIAIFSSLGFSVAEGPDIELEYYNFEALNMPKDHPARDMQDTFYAAPDVVLRTHTSPVQIRTMERQAPPLRIIAPGAVYRHDQDISHTPMFHQVEGLMVDRNVRFSDLKGVLTMFISEMFGGHVPVRFRPSYFPFTEPSAEVDIGCVICKGAGCGVCKKTGWLEILGAGAVHPQLFRNVGYEPEEVSGFAFGMGVERVAMIKFGIDDIKQFYNNDIRFLSQF